MKRQRKIFYVYVLLTLGVMITIFLFSNQNKTESVAVSDSTLEWILQESADWLPTSLVPLFEEKIRKVAHFSIYLLLGVAAALAMNEYRSSREHALGRRMRAAWVFCALYACSDEFHQRFVQGRSAQISDVLLDSVGAAIGVLLIRGIIKIISKWRKQDGETGKIVYNTKI